jgi:hypothetical protein
MSEGGKDLSHGYLQGSRPTVRTVRLGLRQRVNITLAAGAWPPGGGLARTEYPWPVMHAPN